MTTNQHALLIVGMHRSGTSMLTRICNLLGARLGENLMEAAEGNNETGFWEHDDIVTIHDNILALFGLTWHDPHPLPPQWWEREDVQPFAAAIKAILSRDFSDSSLWAVKDPRLSRMLPLWFAILDELEVKPIIIHALRNPFEVANSLGARDSFAEKHALMLWARYQLDILNAVQQNTSSLPYVRIQFHALMENWEKEIARITSAGNFSWPDSTEEHNYIDAIHAFIQPTLKHHHVTTAKQVDPNLDMVIEELSSTEAPFAEYPNVLKLFNPLWEAWSSPPLDYRDAYVAKSKESDANMVKFLRSQNELAQAERFRWEYNKLLIEFTETLRILEKYQKNLEQVLNSTSWKLTAPLRATRKCIQLGAYLINPRPYKRLIEILKKGKFKYYGQQLAYLIREHGFLNAVHHIIETWSRKQTESYPQWIEKHDVLSKKDHLAIQEHIAHFQHKPLISIVLPVYNVERKWLKYAIDSVINQLYPYWELCIADDASTKKGIKELLQHYANKDSRIKVVFRETNGHISAASNSALALATGEFITLLDHDDMITEHALYMVANEINEYPDVDLIYSDEDKINENSERFSHHFKSDWNPDLFYCQNMFSHLGVYRHSLLKEIGGFRLGYEGSQDYDLCLRAVAKTTPEKIRHIPFILYHWRAIETSTAQSANAKTYAYDMAVKAKQDFFDEHFPGAKVVSSKLHVYQRVIWPIPDPAPAITLIIPTRDKLAILKQCVESILEKTTYPNYSILIVDNQSTEHDTKQFFATIAMDSRVRVISYDKPFNFSAINNFAVKHCDTELIGFLNNDLEVINNDWLDEMVSHALRPDIGIVGAKLYYPDDTIQHAGVLTGMGGEQFTPVAGHLFCRQKRTKTCYLGRDRLTQNLSAVTGACMVLRKETFETVGEFNETDLAVAFNDIDLCLRIQEAGYRVLFTPYAELYHHESASRGLEDTPEKIKRFEQETAYMREQWGVRLDNDPYYNPNLCLNPMLNFHLAAEPRVTKPWEKFQKTANYEADNAETSDKKQKTSHKAYSEAA